MPPTGAFPSLVKRAQRRYWGGLLLEQAVFAAAGCLGAIILLLVVGSEILNWYWVTVVAAGAFGLGLWRVWRRRMTAYRVVQRVDVALGSHDLLSTAFYYAAPGCPRSSAREIREGQRAAAERFAAGADVRAAVPVRAPKTTMWTAVALAAIAASLFLLRYGLERRLDLRKPMVAVRLDDFFEPRSRQVAEREPKSAIRKYLDEQTKALGMNAGNLPGDPGQALDFPVSKIEAPGESDRTARREPAARFGNGDEQSESEGEAESAAPGDRHQDAREGNPDSGLSANQSANRRQPGEDSSLMDKMRDAMANLLARLGSPPKPGDSQRPSSQRANQPGRNKQGAGPGRERPDSNQGDQRSELRGEGDERADAQASRGDGDSERPGQQDSKSGIGRSDGDKSVREAEQLAAMGKLSELIGKRSENVSGEITVEVSSSRQQTLKTPYSHRTGAHLETGGESHRDEIPLAYERYVEQYFEQVHKSPTAAARPPQAQGARE